MSLYSVPPHQIDVVVRVAGRQFPAHHSILAEHSGYFREALNRHQSSSSSYKTAKDLVQRIGECESEQSTPTTATSLQISVPSAISSKSFGVLLDFMYSSKLQLDYHNAAEILHCAQILEMPKAVDVCRQYILGSQPRLEYPALGYTTSSCLARLWHTFPPFFHIPASAPTLLNQHPTHHLTQTTDVQQFVQPHHRSFIRTDSSAGAPMAPRLIRPIASRPHHCHPCYHHQLLMSTALTTRANNASHVLVDQLDAKTSTAAQQTTMETATEEPQPQSTSTVAHTSTSVVSDTASSNDSELESVITKAQSDLRSTSITPDDTLTVQQTHHNRTDITSPPPPLDKKVILDVAYCDGPVKFQRILNENCDLVMVMKSVDHRHKRKDEASKSSSKESNKRKSVKKLKELLETRVDDETQSSIASETDAVGNFFCVYCRHTFKSRYCYIKHKRRHLNPLTVENSVKQSQESHCSARSSNPKCKASTVAKAPVTTTLPTTRNSDSLDQSSATKPLEINSTFYPCKICGCKFPSYYFVHKHRHACHPDQNPNSDDGDSNTAEEMDDTNEDDVSVCT